MRYRTRKLPYVALTSTLYSPSSPVELTFPPLSNWFEEAITPVLCPPSSYEEDVMTDIKTKGVWHYNDCEHEKLRASYTCASPFGSALPTSDFWYTNSEFANPKLVRIPCAAFITELKTQHRGMHGNPFPVLRVKEWFKSPQLPTIVRVDRDPFGSKFSIWFLAADIIRLPQLVVQIFTRPIMRRSDAVGSRTVKQLGDDSLMLKFGLFATFRDIKEFFAILNRVILGFEEFDKMYDKTFRWHAPVEECASNVWNPNHQATEVTFGPFGLPVRNVQTFVDVVSCTFTRTMAYRFKCPELKGWLARLKQLVDLFGVLDPSAIWDVIPFSFVIDWFGSVGTWLHNNRPRAFPSTIEVLDYCETIKIVSRRRFYTSHPIVSCFSNTLDGSPLDIDQAQMYSETDVIDNLGTRYRIVHDENGNFFEIGEETYTTYVRKRFTPDIAFSGESERQPVISINQLTVSSALAAQRVPRVGTIGDEFEGVDSGTEYAFSDDPAAKVLHEADVSFSKKMKERRAALLGNGPLWYFEKGSVIRKRPDGNPLDYRLPRREKAVKFQSVLYPGRTPRSALRKMMVPLHGK